MGQLPKACLSTLHPGLRLRSLPEIAIEVRDIEGEEVGKAMDPHHRHKACIMHLDSRDPELDGELTTFRVDR